MDTTTELSVTEMADILYKGWLGIGDQHGDIAWHARTNLTLDMDSNVRLVTDYEGPEALTDYVVGSAPYWIAYYIKYEVDQMGDVGGDAKRKRVEYLLSWGGHLQAAMEFLKEHAPSYDPNNH